MPALTKREERRDKVLLKLRAKPWSTATELDPSPNARGFMRELEKAGFVRKDGERRGPRGRPANTYKLAEKGRKRASTLVRRKAKA